MLYFLNFFKTSIYALKIILFYIVYKMASALILLAFVKWVRIIQTVQFFEDLCTLYYVKTYHSVQQQQQQQ